MHLIQILLPLTDNAGKRFPAAHYRDIKTTLTRRFKGLTVYSRSPAEGIWKPRRGMRRDEIIVYEVMVDRLDARWWAAYRTRLERRFHQDSIVIRAHEVRLL